MYTQKVKKTEPEIMKSGKMQG